MAEDEAVIRSWVEAVTARGVRLEAHGKQLGVLPKSAYNELLTTEERKTLKRHKREIVAYVKEHPHATAVQQPAPAPPLPAPCTYCGQAPCCGADHPAYQALHWNDPAEAYRRDKEATDVMLKMMRRGNPYGRHES